MPPKKDSQQASDIVNAVTTAVESKLEPLVKEVLDKHVAVAVAEIRETFHDRIRALESTCQEIVESLHFTENKLECENRALQVRVRELEHAISQRDHQANLVVSGVQETEGSNENTQSLFLDLCKDTLLVDDLQPSDLVEMVRLGRSKKPNVASAPPRAILVKTRSRAIKAKIMARRGPHLRTSGIFLNDDLSVHEQKARRALVPIFKDFRSVNIRCRLVPA